MPFDEFVDLFELAGTRGHLIGDELVFGERRIPVRDGIPRFTPDLTYSTGNFSLLRERHATLQLDSVNGTRDRRDTVLRRTGWPPTFFDGKLVLECGCGAGPDTEILRSLGARVVSVDIAGTDVCRRNVDGMGTGCIVQADITSLPLRRQTFDIVFCHRVLQHTPDPQRTLAHILDFCAPSGAAFVHSYARTWQQMLRWKYALRPLTTRIDPERLYGAIERVAPALFRLTDWMYRIRGGRRLAYHCVPLLNYSGMAKFNGMSREALFEYAIHDTFDALSPTYDRPLGAALMREIAAQRLRRPFDILEEPTITLLRTLP
jgi:SAM-dependent methyltransferase